MPLPSALFKLGLAVVLGAPVAAGAATPRPAVTAPSTHEFRADPGDLRLAFYQCPNDANQRGRYQPYKVPSDTHSVYVEVVGGQGMTPDPNETGWGGLAGQVTGTIIANPGDVLSVGVGCQGTSGGGASPYGPGGARGVGHDIANWTISGYGISGGGGGGASAVLLNNRPLVVAGGGGGASGGATDCYAAGYNLYYGCFPPVWTSGADGGTGGKPAGAGGVGPTNPFPPAAGGAGCVDGRPTAGQDGDEFSVASAGGAGGGGGGGYLGGCGGRSGPPPAANLFGGSVVPGIPGNGGGGGLSYADATVSRAAFSTADNSGNGYVLFLSGADNTRTTQFPYTGSVDNSVCVPAQTDRIFVDALGGAGAGFPSYSNAGVGGGGGRVQAVVPVQEGTRLAVTVGQGGTSGTAFGNGQGGDRGTAASEASSSGAGGGGASAVGVVSASCTGRATPLGSNGTPLVVAAGGGGGGGNGYETHGGNGGSGGIRAGGGQSGTGPINGNGGCGGCSRSNDGGGGTPSSTGGGGGGGGGGRPGGGLGHGSPDGSAGGGGGGGAGRSFAAVVDPTQVAYTTGRNSQQGGGNGSITLTVPFPSKWSELAIIGGDKQSAYPGQALAAPLHVQAFDSLGFPIRDAPIKFSAPPGYVVLNGVRDTYSTTTDSAGNASVSVVAPTPPWGTGAFAVTAEVTDSRGSYVKAARFSLFNKLLPTAVTATSSTQGNPSNPEQPVQFTASVMTTPPDPYHPDSKQPSSYGIPTGTIQFSDVFNGVTNLLGGPVTLDATGAAKSPMVTGLVKGVHQITASYLGDASHQVFDVSRASLPQAVALSAVTANLTTSPAQVPYPGTVTFALAVVPPSTVRTSPTGTVQFSVDGVNQGAPVMVRGPGVARSAPVAGLGPGLHVGGAVYSGDIGFLPAVQIVPFYVRAASAVSLSENNDGSVTATVRSATAGVTKTPRGLVTFSNTADNQGQLAQTALDAGGRATLPASVKLCCFVNTIVAHYGGEDSFQPSQARLTVYDLLGRRPPTAHSTPPGTAIGGRGLGLLAQLLHDLLGLRG